MLGVFQLQGPTLQGSQRFWGSQQLSIKEGFSHQNQEHGHLTQNPDGHCQNTPWCPRNLLLIGVLIDMG
jgi:hypothetical protein